MNPCIKRLCWQITAVLLAAHFLGHAGAMPLAMLLTAGQSVHALAVRRSVAHLEVQVRVAFLALLLLGTVPGAWPIHAAQILGVNALLAAGYCPLARFLVLMPWNRGGPLSLALVCWVFLARPSEGPILPRLRQWQLDQAAAGR